MFELREKLSARDKTGEQEGEVTETEASSVGRSKVGRRQKNRDQSRDEVIGKKHRGKDQNRDEEVGRKSSRIKRNEVVQPDDVERRSTKMFKTKLSKRLRELSENSTGGARASVVRNEVKKSFLKVKSMKGGNFVKSVKKVDKQKTKNFGRILCSKAGCGEKFTSRKTFLSHRRLVHLGEKLHKCREGNCQSGFCRRRDLDDHMRKKHGDTMLVCDEAGCKKEFCSSNGLSQHNKKHS